jgi:hypothetical protein
MSSSRFKISNKVTMADSGLLSRTFGTMFARYFKLIIGRKGVFKLILAIFWRVLTSAPLH